MPQGDLRRWFSIEQNPTEQLSPQPNSLHAVSTSDMDSDDDTTNWMFQYLDEDPMLRTWIVDDLTACEPKRHCLTNTKISAFFPTTKDI